MLYKQAVAALCAATLTQAAPSKFLRRDGPTGFAWGSEKIRGVNIGGWLVLEPWITPSIFDNLQSSGKQGIVDEYTLGQSLGAQAAYDQVLKSHWETWATYDDFSKIKQAGFNAVRIPIGFWAYDNANTPYASGAAPFLDSAIDWARGLGLKVMIDLHGAPGSQNCFDNSGQKCQAPQWTTGDTVSRTLNVLTTIQNKYGASSYDDVIMGIELLNEPLTPSLNMDTVRQFIYDGYGQQRSVSQSRVVVFQDGFANPSSYNGMLTSSDNNAQNVAIDHHEYQVFTPDLVAMQPWQHRQLVCNNAPAYNAADKWTFVGEWCGAMTDCAKYLNGFNVGARYDGTFPGSSYVGDCGPVNDFSAWSQQFKDDVRGYIEAQMEVFERDTEGWFWWNFKTEGAYEWDALALVDAGIMPQPLTDRKFGAVCS